MVGLILFCGFVSTELKKIPSCCCSPTKPTLLGLGLLRCGAQMKSEFVYLQNLKLSVMCGVHIPLHLKVSLQKAYTAQTRVCSKKSVLSQPIIMSCIIFASVNIELHQSLGDFIKREDIVQRQISSAAIYRSTQYPRTCLPQPFIYFIFLNLIIPSIQTWLIHDIKARSC